MKYIFLTLLVLAVGFPLIAGITACSPEETVPPVQTPVAPDQGSNHTDGNENSGEPDTPEDENKKNMKLDIIIGETVFTATLEENTSVTAFQNMLPMTVSMNDLNRNEKYYYLSGNLPTAATNPGTIQNGDLMLYGSNCLVLFYKTFSTSYSYTRLGTVDNPAGLERALGSGSITVTFQNSK